MGENASEMFLVGGPMGGGGFGQVPYSNQIAYGIHQEDLPHALSFYGPRSSVNTSSYCKSPVKTLECSASHYYGAWHPSLVSVTAGSKCEKVIKKDFFRNIYQCPLFSKTVIESLMLCPRPHWFNSGSHRIMMVMWQGAERYALAVEEASNGFTENLFVQGLTTGAKKKLAADPKLADTLIDSAYFEITGHHVYPEKHRFRTFRYGDEQNLLAEGCTPSTWHNDL